MKRFLISLGVGFIAVFCGYLKETLPIYLDFVAHQPGKVAMDRAYSFSPGTAFLMGSPLWIPLWFVITAAIWTLWTIIKRDPPDLRFPVRLLIFYLLCVASIPTFIVMSDFGNLEATQEEWNWVLGWSYILIGPVLAALYLALRNFRHMPVLTIFAALVALFHVVTTISDYGLIPRYVPDFRFGFDEDTGKVDLGIPSYLLFSAMLAVPLLAAYFLWRLSCWRGARVVEHAS